MELVALMEPGVWLVSQEGEGYLYRRKGKKAKMSKVSSISLTTKGFISRILS